jgi:hypothetical protein
VAGAVRDGLVIVRGRDVGVWNPATGRSRSVALGSVSGTHGDRLVGCRERSYCHDIEILDSRTGRRVVSQTSRLDLVARFSPDGSLIATPSLRHRRWSVALVDPETGRSRLIPGTQTGASYPKLSWAESSGWLFIRGRAGRILAYRPGLPRAVTLPIRLPRGAVAFAAG